MGRQFRKFEASVQRDMHELFTRSAGGLLDRWFETGVVKPLYGFDAVVGNYASPCTADARIHGPRVRRCTPDRQVAQSHCRDADFGDA
jgi:hypothetical protein